MQNKIYIALAAALALGSASAQTKTAAGTTITNIATATFTDPSTSQPGSVDSNEVTTVVNPVPDFTITPNDGGTPGVPDQDAPWDTKAGQTPGSTVEFTYTVTNTGNTPIIVQLDDRIASPNVDRNDTDVQDLTYYVINPDGSRTKLVDTNGDGLVEVPELVATNDKVEIVQVYTIPANATSTQVFGANPVGTAVYDNDATDGVAVGSLTNPDLATVTNADGTTKVDNDNFNQVTLVTPVVDTNPTPDPTNPNGDGSTPPQDGTVVVPPSNPGTNPQDPGLDNGTPNNPVTPDSPEDGSTDAPTQPGYDDPNGVNIVIDGNKQIAYPPADGDTNPDQVTFSNVVTNGGTQADQVTLFPPVITDAAGNPITTGVTATIEGLVDEDPVAPGIQVTLQPGETANYQVVVTYPDNDNSTTPRQPITVTIGVDSGLDGDTTPDATTTDIVMPPAMQFGDSTPTVLGTEPTPAPIQVVDPTKADSANPLDTATSTDGSATFPMDISNTGAYNDTYTLSATVPGIPGATVKYYDANGVELPKNAAGQYITPVVAAGSEIQVFAVVTNIPDNTAAGDYTLSQTATSNYSGITLTDTNDVIRIAPVGNVALAKFTQGGAAPTTVNGIDANTGYGAGPSTANPGANINYQIIGKNNFNAPVQNFAICDTAPTNTTFVSIADTDGTANIYNVNGTWSATAPAAGTTGQICIANDSDGDLVPDALAAGATYTVNFSARVN